MGGVRFQVYDSAHYSAENGVGERTVLWGLRDGGGSLSVMVVGHPLEALLELPPVAGGQRVDWGSDAGRARVLRRTVEGILAGALEGDEQGKVELVWRYRMHGYAEQRGAYYRVCCGTRERLDGVVRGTAEGLSEVFSGVAPVWRETEIDPCTKMFVARGWLRSGWFELPGGAVEEAAGGEELYDGGWPREGGVRRWRPAALAPSRGRGVEHYVVRAGDLRAIREDAELVGLRARPVVLYMDFEALRGNMEGFPRAGTPADMVYMCSVVVGELGAPGPRRYCLCVGDPARGRLGGVEVRALRSEWELYEELGRLIREEDPDVISGYNIHGFDLKYMEARLALAGRDFPDVSRLHGKPSGFDMLRGPRGARYTNLKCPGRVALDLFLYLVKNTSRQELQSFSLKSVVRHYLQRPPEVEAELRVCPPGSSGAGGGLVYSWGPPEALEVRAAPWDPEFPGAAGAAGDAGAGGALGELVRVLRGAGAPLRGVRLRGGQGAGGEGLLRLGEGLRGLGVGVVRVEGAGGEELWAAGAGEGKIELGYREQFELYLRYLMGFPGGAEGLGRVAEYCVRDSEVLPGLMAERGVWETCVQFSNIHGAPLQAMAVAGQVERLTPLLYRYVRGRETVMEVNPAAGSVKFEGGYVKLSARGLCSRLGVGDFASLYPSLMIDNNFCWCTHVQERDTARLMAELPEGSYVVVDVEYEIAADARPSVGEWDAAEGAEGLEDPEDPAEREGAELEAPDPEEAERPGVEAVRKAVRKGKRAIERDAVFVKRRERVMYVRQGVREGIIPLALRSLLAERARIRKKQIPALKAAAKAAGSAEEAAAYRVLAADADKQQLAIKVAANSIYGIMGASAPYACPFVGMCTTASGRAVIERATALIVGESPGTRRHVYTDTDSSMVQIEDGAIGALPLGVLQRRAGCALEELGVDPAELPVWCAEGYRALLRAWGESRTALEHNCVIGHAVDACEGVCAVPDRAKIYGPPMTFAAEGVVVSGIFLQKKFYMLLMVDAEKKQLVVKERGVIVRRGDYPAVVKEIYGEACRTLLEGRGFSAAMRGIAAGVRRILAGEELRVEECRISTEFRSLDAYKEASCKMATLARRAAEMGLPLPENTRVDIVMLANPGARAGDAGVLSKKGNSANLATAEMSAVLQRPLDRDHYLSVLISHVDTLVECVGVELRGMVAYFLPGAALREAGAEDPAAPLLLRRGPCQCCGKPMQHYVGGTGAGGVMHAICNGLRVQQSCLTCNPGGPERATLLRGVSTYVWELSAPMASFLKVYVGMLREDESAPLEAVRRRAAGFFGYVTEMFYCS